MKKQTYRNDANKTHLLILYSAILILFANWFLPKEIYIFENIINFSAIVIAPVFVINIFILIKTNFRSAILAIGVGVIFSCFAFIYGQMSVHFPTPDYGVTLANQYSDFMQAAKNRFFYFLSATIASCLLSIIFFEKTSARLKKRYFLFLLSLTFCLGVSSYVIIFNRLIF